MAQPIVLTHEEMYNIVVPSGAVAIETGDFIDYTSEAAVLMDAATEDTDFLGIALGGCKVSSTGTLIPVAIKCIIEVDLTSGVYTLGEALIWTASNKLATSTAGAAAIAWFYDAEKIGDTITRGRVLVDAVALAASTTTTKIFETPAA
jgi:hypothetical protein